MKAHLFGFHTAENMQVDIRGLEVYHARWACLGQTFCSISDSLHQVELVNEWKQWSSKTIAAWWLQVNAKATSTSLKLPFLWLVLNAMLVQLFAKFVLYSSYILEMSSLLRCSLKSSRWLCDFSLHLRLALKTEVFWLPRLWKCCKTAAWQNCWCDLEVTLKWSLAREIHHMILWIYLEVLPEIEAMGESRRLVSPANCIGRSSFLSTFQTWANDSCDLQMHRGVNGC